MRNAYTDLTTRQTVFFQNGKQQNMKAADFLFYMAGPIESFMEAAWPDYNPRGIYA